MRKATRSQVRFLKVTEMDIMIHPIMAKVLMAHGANPAGEYHLIPENHPDISFFLISLENPTWVSAGFEDGEIHTVLGK